MATKLKPGQVAGLESPIDRADADPEKVGNLLRGQVIGVLPEQAPNRLIPHGDTSTNAIADDLSWRSRKNEANSKKRVRGDVHRER